MKNKEYSFTEFKFSSQLIRDLIEERLTVKPFVGSFFSYDNIYEQAQRKVFTTSQRLALVEQLEQQNAEVTLSVKSKSNIEILKRENAFTITTGHQLNLLTGPLYSIYKVLQVVRITNEMNLKKDGNIYVPVFWMATEDHDFEEINHLHLFGDKIAWEKEGQEDAIVGEISTKQIMPFLEAVEHKYREASAREIVQQFTDIYRETKNLAAATRKLMNTLFGVYGLVIIDGNDVVLKRVAKPIFKSELEDELTFTAVTKSNKELDNANYHNQVYLRRCNLFHIAANGRRERIAKEEGRFSFGNQNYTEDELLSMFDDNPGSFSPNALLRPVYQEFILPNLVYVGGGGEIAYWLQLKRIFDALSIPFPLLRVRDSIILLNEKQLSDLEDLNYTIPNLKQDVNVLLKEIALSEVEYEVSLDTEQADLNEIKLSLIDKAKVIDQSLIGMIEAEFSKFSKSIEKIEQRLIKSEKSKHEKKGKKIIKLQEKIFPAGGFQERYENFIPYFVDNSNFVNDILEELKPDDQPKIRICKL